MTAMRQHHTLPDIQKQIYCLQFIQASKVIFKSHKMFWKACDMKTIEPIYGYSEQLLSH